MFRSARLLFLIAIAALVSACATAPGQKFSGVAAPATDRGDVYLYRTSAFFSGGASFEVMLNGSKVGDLYNASYLHLQLPPGLHLLKVSPGGLAQTSDHKVQVEPAKTLFLQYDFVTGPLANIFFIGSSIQPRSKEQALLDMQELNSAK